MKKLLQEYTIASSKGTAFLRCLEMVENAIPFLLEGGAREKFSDDNERQMVLQLKLEGRFLRWVCLPNLLGALSVISHSSWTKVPRYSRNGLRVALFGSNFRAYFFFTLFLITIKLCNTKLKPGGSRKWGVGQS